MFSPGDMIKFKNNAGILEVQIQKKLNAQCIAQGLGTDKLPTIENPRLEFHRDRFGDVIVTLCNNQDELPCEMFVFVLNPDSVEAYLGVFNESEKGEDVFYTI